MYLDEVDSVLSAQGLNKADVSGLIAVLCEDAQVGSPPVECLDALMETTAHTVVDKGLLEDLLHSGHDVHGLGASLGGPGLNHFCISFLRHGTSLLGVCEYAEGRMVKDAERKKDTYMQILMHKAAQKGFCHCAEGIHSLRSDISWFHNFRLPFLEYHINTSK